jgi:RNA polymerase sigma-70 factor, ECF subfamily
MFDAAPHLAGPFAEEDGLSAFLRTRSRLFGIAYRVLGSAAEAEDVVQDAWLRWQATDRSVVRDAAAFLATTTMRLSLTVVQSARSRHEVHVEPWLPESGDTSADPASEAERGEALERAFRLLLEKLSPMERAAWVLSEAFDSPYTRIADLLRVTEANARQLASRARKHLASDRHEPVASSEQRRLLDAFLGAAQTGDLAGLEDVFRAAAAITPDGAGDDILHAA